MGAPVVPPQVVVYTFRLV